MSPLLVHKKGLNIDTQNSFKALNTSTCRNLGRKALSVVKEGHTKKKKVPEAQKEYLSKDKKKIKIT